MTGAGRPGSWDVPRRPLVEIRKSGERRPVGGRRSRAMSMFESDDFQWRETYFVLFDSGKRPTLEKMVATLQELGGQFQLNSSQGDDDGHVRVADADRAG